jgi:hypothetical protein
METFYVTKVSIKIFYKIKNWKDEWYVRNN